MDIARIRKEFPIVRRKIYLNHASIGPPSISSVNALNSLVKLWRDKGDYWSEGMNRIKIAKREFASLIGAKEHEIALVPNTSTGVSIVANMLDYSKKCNIVLNDLEFPSNYYPWLNRARIKIVKNRNGVLSIADFEKLIDRNTTIVPVSHVQYSNGFKLDLKAVAEITHKHGAYFFVDGIQSIGALKFNVKKYDIDFLVCGCTKWLLSPPGTGFLYVRDDLISRFQPRILGWLSVENPEYTDEYRFKLDNSACRFETGTPDIFGYAAVAESLKLIRRVGISNIENRIYNLINYLIEHLKSDFQFATPLEASLHGSIFSIRMKHPEKVMVELREKSIITVVRRKALRISPHFYNTEEELDKLIDVILNYRCKG